MATSTKIPSDTPASIEARRAAVAAAKERLQQVQAALAAAERAAQAQAQAKARKEDTRRKVLTGALIQTASAADAEMAAYVLQLADIGLTRADERALFGLDPLPAAAPAQPQDDAPTPAQDPAIAAWAA
jgi:small-conductance mechanosensitive channel